MLAGDFTVSPRRLCNGGRQVNLRAPYEQPDQSGALQSRRVELGQAGCRARPIRAASSRSTSSPTATRRSRSSGSTTSWARRTPSSDGTWPASSRRRPATPAVRTAC
jgi:hypothetical protein